MADAGRPLDRVREIPAPEPEGRVHQGDQHRHLDEGADDRRKGLAGIDAENRHGHRDGKFKVV